MFWFDLLFPPLMIVMPAAMCLLLRPPREVAYDRAAVARLSRYMALGTAIALGLFAAAWFGAGQSIARFAWVLCFPLFGMAMPLMNARNPHWCIHDAQQPVRRAALVNRARQSPVGRGWYLAMWLIWLAGVAAVAARLTQPLDQRQWMLWAVAVVCIMSAMLTPLLVPRAVRQVMGEPEPLDAGNSPQLAAAYQANRNFRAWGFVIFGLVMGLLFTSIPVALAWLQVDAATGALWGWIGGGLGSLVGIGGGVFGTICTLRRGKIALLKAELDRGSIRSA